MLYRENGQFKSSYASDQQMLPILQDRVFMLLLLAPRMGWDLVRTAHPWLQILRGMLLVVSTAFFYL